MLQPHVCEDIIGIMELMKTDWFRKHEGKCRLMSKENVYIAMNKQGATSLFSDACNMKAFCDFEPMWYELGLSMVQRWMVGESNGTFMTIMNKNESKIKKNVNQGRIKLDNGKKEFYDQSELRKELEDACDLPHRFIQYADEITRIAHYILFGEMISLANKQKLYKGTINGTPPFNSGNILQAVYDMNEKPENRIFTNTHIEGEQVRQEKRAPIRINCLNKSFCDEKGHMRLPTSVGQKASCMYLDYSGWDGNVSAQERALEAKWMSSLYVPELEGAIMNCCRELCYAVCINHTGDMILRGGQRGSGEILTLIGNTVGGCEYI